MSDPILDKASFQLIRTNPKLTTNVKLVVDSNENLYLESFSANPELSSSRYKAFKVSSTSSYDRDVYSFYSRFTLPSTLAYQTYQNNSDLSTMGNYDDQYENFYTAGAESISSEVYPEDLGILAPIWLEEQIPDYFVVFRTNGPVNSNLVNKTNPLSGIEEASTSIAFNEKILNNSVIIKTFDLRPGSKLGDYIRNYRNASNFPESPFFASYTKGEPSMFRGISYDKGGFIEKGEYLYDEFFTKDKTIIENEFFVTEGFQRESVISANLINMQFLFSDVYAENYSINRYFGLFANEVNEGSFKLNSDGFYNNASLEKTQTPPTSSDQINELLNTEFVIENPNGVVIYTKDFNTITGYPTQDRVNSMSSVFYVKDKNDQFHSIKRGSHWKPDSIRLSDQKIDISNLTGFSKPSTYVEGAILENKGASAVVINVLASVPDAVTIKFYDGISETLRIVSDKDTATVPGTNFQYYFNGTGSPEDIANSMREAIIWSQADRLFDVVSTENSIIIYSRFEGSRFNRLSFEISDNGTWFSSYPSGTGNINFTGGSNLKNARLKIPISAKDRILNKFIKCGSDFGQCIEISPYVEEPVYNLRGEIIAFNNIDKFYSAVFNKEGITDPSVDSFAIYDDYVPTFGRLSFFPVKDFDFDFYSNQYSGEGELNEEFDHYNVYAPDDGVLVPVEESSYPQVYSFYQNGGFAKLQPVLKQETGLLTDDVTILSEYDRLFENFNKNLAVSSRTVPYICKWTYDDFGRDVRNKTYRFNFSEAFGIYNFSPSSQAFAQDPLSFTHEWYYLSKVPDYFDATGLLDSWSYFNETVDDTFFASIDSDNFTNYFVVDYLKNSQATSYFEKQIRYGRFKGGNSQLFAETFLRGVKIIAKRRTENSQIDFNLNSKKFTNPAAFNDYKFSAILIPNRSEKPVFEIKVIENKKWKTITLMIFLTIDYQDMLPFGDSDVIDRTLLYCLDSKIVPDSNGDFIPVGNTYNYYDSPMSGTINVLTSAFDTGRNQYKIVGQPDINGNPTIFTKEILLGPSGIYNSVEIVIDNGPIAGTYLISGITEVPGDGILYANSFTRNGIPFGLPYFSPYIEDFLSATYTVIDGGFRALESRMIEASYASIAERINAGNPNVIYETVNEDGSKTYNEFVLELRSQDLNMKSIYLDFIRDPNKPTSFNLQEVIGYELTLASQGRTVPFLRHSGKFSPKFVDLFKFIDPYIQNEVSTSSSGNDDTEYKQRVFDLCRFKNTQFDPTFYYFGQIRNYFYHKVNSVDPGGVLELSTNSSFLSVYPLIDEVAIDKRERFYTFSSSWDPGYFQTSQTKSDQVPSPGTFSTLEKKGFFASKYVKVEQDISFDLFDPQFLNINEVDSSIIVNFKIEDRLVSYLKDKLRNEFLKYVNPQFTLFNQTSIESFMDSYIRKNLIPLYKVSDTMLYIQEDRAIFVNDYSYFQKTNVQKIAAGLRPTRTFNVKYLNSSQLDFQLIYIKKSGHSVKMGANVSLIKR